MKLKTVSWFVSHHCYHKCLYACFFFFSNLYGRFFQVFSWCRMFIENLSCMPSLGAKTRWDYRSGNTPLIRSNAHLEITTCPAGALSSRFATLCLHISPKGKIWFYASQAVGNGSICGRWERGWKLRAQQSYCAFMVFMLWSKADGQLAVWGQIPSVLVHSFGSVFISPDLTNTKFPRESRGIASFSLQMSATHHSETTWEKTVSLNCLSA